MPPLPLILASALLAGAASAPVDARPAAPLKADRIVVEKSRHRLTLFAGDRVLRRYRVALSAGGLAPKRRQGDARYLVDWRNPNSADHLALHISYPGAADVATAVTRGEKPGGDIMIHGLPNGFGVVGALRRQLV